MRAEIDGLGHHEEEDILVVYGGIASFPDSYALDCAGQQESLNQDVWVRVAGDWLRVRVGGKTPPPRYKHKCTASLSNGSAMVCVGGIGSTSAPGIGITLSDTWLFSIKITSAESSYWAYGTWTQLVDTERPLGPRHSFVMVNSPRQSTDVQSNLEGFIVFGGSSSTACMDATQPALPESQWAHSDVWMLVTSGLSNPAGNLTASWLQLFPLNAPSHAGQLQDMSRAAAAGAMINDTLLVYGGHTSLLTPSAHMPASTMSLQGSHCLVPSSSVHESCFWGAHRMNVTVQIELEDLDLPQPQFSNANCDISIHLEEASGAVLTYDTVEHQRCVVIYCACMSHIQLFTETYLCRRNSEAFQFHGVKFASNTSATAIATWCGTVLGSADFDLEAGGNVLLQLSPVQSIILKVFLSSDEPDVSSTQADLVLQYHDRVILLEPVMRSGSEVKWKV